jgi:cytoskeleton protein RodZ
MPQHHKHIFGDDFYTDVPVGDILRRARVQIGMTIPEVEKYLRIRAGHLEALEQSNFSALPGRVYVIGFVRSYAEFLNLDGARVVDLLKRQSSGLTTPQAMNVFIPAHESRLPSMPVLASAGAGLLLLILMWVTYQNARFASDVSLPSVPETSIAMASLEKLTENTAPDAVPLAEEADPSTIEGVIGAAVAAPVVPIVPAVEIKLLGDSWIELRNPEGRVVEARIFRAGETLPIETPVDEFGNAYSLTMGNAGEVQILLDGQAIPPLGHVNKVRRNVTLNPKTLKSLIPN